MKYIPKLIVHGGAWNIPTRLHSDHITGCREVVEAVYPQLREGLSALDAVERAVNLLEENPTFNAGRGSFLNARGEIELDAIICDGREVNFGAVASVQNILHPVTAARLVMEKSEHCFLVGCGAQEFLREHHFPEVAIEELLTERELRYYRKIKSDPNFTTRKPFEPHPGDTVGAVAMDVHGNLAAATSTGGTPRKLPGRVGDSPVFGAGAYADNRTGAASATGWGESILRVLLSRTVCDFLASMPPREAAQQGIRILNERTKGLGGIIGINRKGEYAIDHNTPWMAMAFFEPGKGVHAGIGLSSLQK